MYLPSVRPIDFLDIYISGDVTIDESAVIAPGTILKAAQNSRIVIGAGVCVGMGTILNACDGAIAVEEGATLGAGVLIVGQVKISKNACIGAATTIFNASVDPMAVIPAGSLIGDTSRQGEKDPDPQMNHSHHAATVKKVPQKLCSIPGKSRTVLKMGCLLLSQRRGSYQLPKQKCKLRAIALILNSTLNHQNRLLSVKCILINS